MNRAAQKAPAFAPPENPKRPAHVQRCQLCRGTVRDGRCQGCASPVLAPELAAAILEGRARSGEAPSIAPGADPGVLRVVERARAAHESRGEPERRGRCTAEKCERQTSHGLCLGCDAPPGACNCNRRHPPEVRRSAPAGIVGAEPGTGRLVLHQYARPGSPDPKWPAIYYRAELGAAAGEGRSAYEAIGHLVALNPGLFGLARPRDWQWRWLPGYALEDREDGP